MSSTPLRSMADDIAGGGDISPAKDSRPEPIVQRRHPGVGNSSLVLRSLSDVQPQQIDYLWKPWLARGKFHLLGGLPFA
jgi:hypothetical protein